MSRLALLYEIQNAALSQHENFSNLQINEQTVASLGMNSILDLTYEYGEGRSIIFSRDQWDNLLQLYKPNDVHVDDGDIDINQLTQAFQESHAQLMKAKISTTTKKTKLLTKVEEWKERYKSEDEKFVLFLINHILDLHQNYNYLFDTDINCSGWDFLLKILAPIIEMLFKVTVLRTKREDTVRQTKNDNGGVESKINLRVLLNKKLKDVMLNMILFQENLQSMTLVF